MLRFFIHHDKPCSLSSFQSYLPSSQKRREKKEKTERNKVILIYCLKRDIFGGNQDKSLSRQFKSFPLNFLSFLVIKLLERMPIIRFLNL